MKNLIPHLCLLMALFVVSACSDDKVEEEVIIEKTYINVDESQITFLRLASSQTVKIDSNLKDITCDVASGAKDWCSASYTNGVLTITALPNNNMGSRTGTVSIGNKNLRKTVSVTQSGREAGNNALKDDIKIKVKSGKASSQSSGGAIEKSFDDNMSTMYHSNYNNSGSTATYPVTLSYNFENVASMDYIIYYPRTSGTNGFFGAFDLYVATENNPTLTKYGRYDFQKKSTPSVISFSSRLVKPTQIQFVLDAGNGNHLSCAEMEFYQRNPENFDYTTIFTDASCSEVKKGITEAHINNIENQFFRELALEIYRGEYESEFRVQNYKAWQHPNVMSSTNKTGTYSLRDNPTGIYAQKDEDIIVFVGDTHNQSIALFIQDPDKMISGSSYPLSSGMNKIKADNNGLIYILYHTSLGTEPEIKVNIVTGYVNGYFDSEKHKREDWKNLLEKATFRHFDLIGKHAHMTFETDKFRQFTPDGLALIEKYDDLVYLEQEFMGLFEYKRAFKNRMYFLVMSGSSHMHASSYYTGYDVSTQKDILNLANFVKSPWGPAHEVGHVNQTRPGLKWLGMTEVTNNIHSLYVQTQWGNKSRLITNNQYQKATEEIIERQIAHNESSDVFNKLVPFWQLKLYMHDALGNDKFYKQVYETIRTSANPKTDGACQIEFVKIVCDVAKLDLTEFFEAWGFLREIDREINDYSKGQFIVTKEMINDCKAYIASKNYPKPKHTVQNITDDNVKDFK